MGGWAAGVLRVTLQGDQPYEARRAARQDALPGAMRAPYLHPLLSIGCPPHKRQVLRTLVFQPTWSVAASKCSREDTSTAISGPHPAGGPAVSAAPGRPQLITGKASPPPDAAPGTCTASAAPLLVRRGVPRFWTAPAAAARKPPPAVAACMLAVLDHRRSLSAADVAASASPASRLCEEPAGSCATQAASTAASLSPPPPPRRSVAPVPLPLLASPPRAPSCGGQMMSRHMHRTWGSAASRASHCARERAAMAGRASDSPPPRLPPADSDDSSAGRPVHVQAGHVGEGEREEGGGGQAVAVRTSFACPARKSGGSPVNLHWISCTTLDAWMHHAGWASKTIPNVLNFHSPSHLAGRGHRAAALPPAPGEAPQTRLPSTPCKQSP
eukprot:365643-Chlamydomonas_euryale.AAC.7